MGRYLDLAREAANIIKPEIERANARRLEEAGWKSKESFGGVVIWERPDTRFYVSEEMAIHLLESADRVRYVVNGENPHGNAANSSIHGAAKVQIL